MGSWYYRPRCGRGAARGSDTNMRELTADDDTAAADSDSDGEHVRVRGSAGMKEHYLSLKYRKQSMARSRRRAAVRLLILNFRRSDWLRCCPMRLFGSDKLNFVFPFMSVPVRVCADGCVVEPRVACSRYAIADASWCRWRRWWCCCRSRSCHTAAATDTVISGHEWLLHSPFTLQLISLSPQLSLPLCLLWSHRYATLVFYCF